jgi:glycerol-3-phosphate dehydrogenase
MWQQGWREKIFAQVDAPWDLIIIGGGITGAGILRAAVGVGLRALLVEANDFAFGTSSRSSKLIHGGIRYLRNWQVDVTYESVREREWVLREAGKLVTPLSFLVPVYAENERSQRGLGLQILAYDLMAPKWWHRFYTRDQLLEACPLFRSENLRRGYMYGDALMDDAQVVLRVIREAVRAGGVAINYASAERLLRTQNGDVCGIVLRDRAGNAGKTYEVKAHVVVNASGPWSDEVRGQIGAPARLRKLRGSHLVLPRELLPLPDQAVHLLHPKDYRTMFTFPWEGAAIVGTTDLDHDPALERRQAEPCASEAEIDYIVAALQFTFPKAGITRDAIVSTFAGLRPVVNTGKARPSDESRAHTIWEEDGLLTIAGGKYTIFRVMADDVLARVSQRLPGHPSLSYRGRYFDPLPASLPRALAEAPNQARLLGRFAGEVETMAAAAQPGELEPIPGQVACWAELRWAARCEGVVHLDDLLLRRVRIGMTSPGGALADIEKIRTVVQPELGWDDQRWAAEVEAYRNTWMYSYSPAPAGNAQ